MGIESFELGIALCPYNKESHGLVHPVQPMEIQVPSIHDIDGTGLHRKLIENFDVVYFPMCDENDAGDIAPKVQEGMHFYGTLALSKLGPREQGQTEVYGGRIQSIDCLIQLDTEVFFCVKRLGNGDQNLGEIGVDSPVSDQIGVGQGIAGNLAAKAHMIKLGLGDAKACLDISKALPEGELSKGHAKELVPTRETFDLVASFVPCNAFTELVLRQEVHQLRENRFAGVHVPLPPQGMGKYGPYRPGTSNPKAQIDKSIFDINLMLFQNVTQN